MSIRSIKPINYIFGLLFAFSIVAGYQCEFFGRLIPGSWKTYFFFVLVFVVATLFSYVFWDMIKERADREISNDDKTTNPGKIWAGSSVVIWICNFIVFLGVYPGFFVYDAFEELNETITRSFNDQHPIFHVLSMGAVIQAMHKLTGDYNISVAVFILLQMSFNAIILGYVVRELYVEAKNKKLCIGALIYFALFPVLMMCNLCSAKDCVFTGLLVLLTIYLRRMFLESDFDKSSKNLIKLGLLSTFMMLYRSNGVYAFIVFAVLVLLLRKVSKRTLTVMIVSVIAYFVINTGLLGITNAQRVGHREILTVPIMQLSRVYAYDNESMTGEEKAKLESYIPRENLLSYTPKCSDLVKIGFDEKAFEGDKAGFYKLWLSTGIKHPVAYMDALCMTGYGMWYPNATIDGYKGREVFTFTYGDSSYFGYETEPPAERHSFIPAIDRFFRYLSIEGGTRAIPIVHFLFSPGFMLWVLLFIIGYFVYTQNVSKALSYALPLTVILTCFIGPMSLVRYAFCLWIIVPFGFTDMFIKEE
ncbi:MAG: DUF6020 family protein [Lachnospiraceae bacterium]|nr:DUF6020 family protein [Lachnospiraceae bacterium]